MKELDYVEVYAKKMRDSSNYFKDHKFYRRI